MSVDVRYIHIAVSEAMASKGGRKIGAVIFKDQVFIGKGHYDSRMYHPSTGHRYTMKPEMMAMIRSKRPLKGASALLVAVDKNMKRKTAKPSMESVALMKGMGIEKIYYSKSDGTIAQVTY